MPATLKNTSLKSLIKISPLLLLGLGLLAGPAQAAPGQPDPDYPPSQAPAHQRALTYDHRSSPKQVNLIGRFNPADHRPAPRATSRQAPAPTMFFDLDRVVEVEVDAWYGKAGVQINW